jgi:hypothetical protein
MKFYIDKYGSSNYFYKKIKSNNITALYQDHIILFYKNGKRHNARNAADIIDNSKIFYLNGEWYGANFTKESWRKFIKLKAFL